MGPTVVLDAEVRRKIPRPLRESNPRTPIVQPVAQCYTDWATLYKGNYEWQFIGNEVFVKILYSIFLFSYKNSPVLKTPVELNDIRFRFMIPYEGLLLTTLLRDWHEYEAEC
jgi:hypothetical protein